MSSQQPLNNESEIWLGGMSGKNGKSCTKQIDIDYVTDLHVKLWIF